MASGAIVMALDFMIELFPKIGYLKEVRTNIKSLLSLVGLKLKGDTNE